MSSTHLFPFVKKIELKISNSKIAYFKVNKKVMRTKNARRTKSYVTNEKILKSAI